MINRFFNLQASNSFSEHLPQDLRVFTTNFKMLPCQKGSHFSSDYFPKMKVYKVCYISEKQMLHASEDKLQNTRY